MPAGGWTPQPATAFKQHGEAAFYYSLHSIVALSLAFSPVRRVTRAGLRANNQRQANSAVYSSAEKPSDLTFPLTTSTGRLITDGL